MCAPASKLDKKTRSLLAVVNLSLAVGITMLNIGRSHGQAAQAWLDGICGFCIGLSIGVYFFISRRGRRFAS